MKHKKKPDSVLRFMKLTSELQGAASEWDNTLLSTALILDSDLVQKFLKHYSVVAKKW